MRRELAAEARIRGQLAVLADLGPTAVDVSGSDPMNVELTVVAKADVWTKAEAKLRERLDRMFPGVVVHVWRQDPRPRVMAAQSRGAIEWGNRVLFALCHLLLGIALGAMLVRFRPAWQIRRRTRESN